MEHLKDQDKLENYFFGSREVAMPNLGCWLKEQEGQEEVEEEGLEKEPEAGGRKSEERKQGRLCQNIEDQEQVQRIMADVIKKRQEKSRVRETLNLSTDADSSTDAIGGWTKNTPKPAYLNITASCRYITASLKQARKISKKNFFCAAIFDNFQTKMFKYETTSFHFFSPRILNL